MSGGFYTDPAGPRWDRKPGETMFDSTERLTAGERARDIVRRFAPQPCGCCVSGDAAELRDFITRAIEAAVRALPTARTDGYNVAEEPRAMLLPRGCWVWVPLPEDVKERPDLYEEAPL